MKPIIIIALAACSTGDTRVHLAVTAPSLVLDRYQILVGELAALAQPLAAIDVEVPGELAGSAQTLDVWGLDAGAQVAFGTTSVTPIEHETVTAQVTLAAASCGSACNLGDTACAGSGVTTCELIGNCLAFGPPIACDSGDACTAGACSAPPACSQSGSACNDGNPCTVDDACTTGACTGSPKCTAAPANAVATCAADGTCDFACNMGYTRSGSACTAPSKQIFMSSEASTGDLGGLAGADSLCQHVAASAGLAGTFKAWLSDSSTSASSRLTHATVPYVFVDGTVVATSWTELTSGHIEQPLDVNEMGGRFETEAWTGTQADGTYGGDDCEDWTAGMGIGIKGDEGYTDTADATWTDQGTNFCNTSMPLYCLEQ